MSYVTRKFKKIKKIKNKKNKKPELRPISNIRSETRTSDKTSHEANRFITELE